MSFQRNSALVILSAHGSPAIWQKAHTCGTKGDLTTTQWKNKLKARAAELFPAVDVTLWNADALLIYDAATRRAIN